MTKVPRLFFTLILLAGEAAAQQRRLTVEDIYDPDKKHETGGTPAVTLTWIDDQRFHWPKGAERKAATQHVRVDAATGREEPLFDQARLRAEIEKQAGVSADEARALSEQTTYAMDDRFTALVVAAGGDLYLFEFASGALRRLTRSAGAEEEPAFSPDGAQVAFVRGGNLHVVGRDGGGERALTTDGGPEVLNGKLDWVYQEEIYGRGKFKGYWWSPDSKSLAFLQLKETGVPTFPVVDDIPYQPLLELERYPKAGDKNPEVRLGVVAATAGPPRWVDLARWSAEEPLVVQVGWTPDARQVAFQVQDRIQTWLDLVLADRETLQTKVLFRETTKAWVEPHDNGLQFLKDGTFLWLSERTGWKHVYHYRGDGTLVRPVTSGEWEARTLHGADPAQAWVYFGGTQRSHIAEDVYRIRLDGTGLERLSRPAGNHIAVFNGSRNAFLDTWSDATTPPQIRLHAADGAERRTIVANVLPRLKEFGLVKPEFVQVPNRDGFPMEAMLLKPPGFDPAKKYPVYQHTYGGPHAPQVKDKWDSNTSLFHQMLAQRGIVVWICDNRTASGKGAVNTWPLYKNFGETELRDIEDGLDWLARQPWVDTTRIGINGWSYGGYMVAYALTHSRRFAMGISGAPVTDYRDYDSIYTERYMDLPKNNPEGYRKSAPRHRAEKLSGKLLLIHGGFDDNVHPQNTTQFAYDLQKAGRPFRLMLYPRQRHSFTDPEQIQHLRSMMLAFVEETLLGAPAHAWPLDQAPEVTSSGGSGSRRRSP